MYRALYGFRSAEPNSLAFAVGETFLLLERSNQHWWLVTRAGSGETGYVPASYLQRLQVRQGQRTGEGSSGVGGLWRWPRTGLEVSAAFSGGATRAPLGSAGLCPQVRGQYSVPVRRRAGTCQASGKILFREDGSVYGKRN